MLRGPHVPLLKVFYLIGQRKVSAHRKCPFVPEVGLGFCVRAVLRRIRDQRARNGEKRSRT